MFQTEVVEKLKTENFTVSPCILYHKVSLVPTYALVFKLH